MYVCLLCYKEYKYEKNLKRHLKEKHSGLESYNCTETGCNGKFIRRDFLYNHICSIHHMEAHTARKKSINATRGDQHNAARSNQQQYYEDISDDDTIFDLIGGLEETEGACNLDGIEW